MYQAETHIDPSNPDAGTLTVSFQPEGAVILGCSPQSTQVVIPAVINGAPVVRIGSEAFMKHPHLLSITLPDTVRSIGFAAFLECPVLRSIRAGKGLETVEAHAFSDCVNLLEVDFPSRPRASLTSFSGCYQLEAAHEPVTYS